MDCYTYDGYLGQVETLEHQLLTQRNNSWNGNYLEIPYESKCSLTIILDKDSRLINEDPEKILILSELSVIYASPTSFGINKEDFHRGKYKEIKTRIYLEFYPSW